MQHLSRWGEKGDDLSIQKDWESLHKEDGIWAKSWTMSRYSSEGLGDMGQIWQGEGARGHNQRTETHGRLGPPCANPLQSLSKHFCLNAWVELDPQFPKKLPSLDEHFRDSGLRCLRAASTIKACVGPLAPRFIAKEYSHGSRGVKGYMFYGRLLATVSWLCGAQMHRAVRSCSQWEYQSNCLENSYSFFTPTYKSFLLWRASRSYG